MNEQIKLKKNPSREACESIIRRILTTEASEKGKNEHFRQASDFLPYFESLYPASDSLTKQVQRAVKSMNMPKDEHGYFIINKTHSQLKHEAELKQLFQKASASLDPLENCETVFLEMDEGYSDYFLHLLSHSETFQGQYVTAVKACNGVFIYTRTKQQFVKTLTNLME